MARKVITTSYGQRLGNSLKGIGTGFIMIIVATCLLWWNEDNTYSTAQTIDEVQQICEHVDNVSSVNSEYEGKVIHATAEAVTSDTISDPMFTSVRANCIKINRKVEYYQWQEHEHRETHDKVGGGQETTIDYTYSKDWCSSPVNSSNFEESSTHRNTVRIEGIKDEQKMAENVTFGAYKLPDFLVSSMSKEDPVKSLNIPADMVAETNKAAGGSQTTINAAEVAADTTNNTLAEAEFVHQKGNVLYIGRNSGSPEIGDMRITFTYVLPSTVSIIAKQQGSTFVKYTSSKYHKSYSKLVQATSSQEEMLEASKNENSFMAWALRIVGILLAIGGFKSIFSILYMLFKVLPFLADIVEMGVGLVAGILGITWSLIIIAIAWIACRPFVYGGILLAIAVGLIAWAVMKGKKAKAEKPAVEPAPAQ